MRLKLVAGASSIAAVVGAGSSMAIVFAASSSLKPLGNPGLFIGSVFLLPVAAIVFASIFVYRHTARRRKLQALLTAIVATLLTLCLFVLASILSSRRDRIEPHQPVGPHVAF